MPEFPVDDELKDKQRMLFIPRLLHHWPWPRMVNPHCDEVGVQSDAWFRGLKAFTPKSQDAFEKLNTPLLASLSYPTASKEHLRTATDLMNLFFLIDEYTDVETAPEVQRMIDIVLDAFHNPYKTRPEGEVVLGQATKEFWTLAVQTAPPSLQKHFVEVFTIYLQSIVTQAQDREDQNIHTIEDYMKSRRDNVGARPCYVLAALGLNLPVDVFYHPVIEELEYLGAELMILCNDIVSYNKEQANGDDRHNVLTIAMNLFQTDLANAVLWAGKRHEEVEAKFLELMKCVPSWGPEVDTEVAKYIAGIGFGTRANETWSFESERYLGRKGLEIQRTRCVPLLPKYRSSAGLRRGNVDVPLVGSLVEL